MYMAPPAGHGGVVGLGGAVGARSVESSTSSSHVGVSLGQTSVRRQKLRRPCRKGRLGGVGYVLQ